MLQDLTLQEMLKLASKVDMDEWNTPTRDDDNKQSCDPKDYSTFGSQMIIGSGKIDILLKRQTLNHNYILSVRARNKFGLATMGYYEGDAQRCIDFFEDVRAHYVNRVKSFKEDSLTVIRNFI